MNTVTVSILGCGARGGTVYGPMMFRHEQFKIVSICDIRQERIDRYRKEWNISAENCFLNEEEFFQKKRSDLLLIATQDKDHVRQGIKALELGYDILMEKPISPYEEELQALLQAQKKYDKKIMICHVLRYAPAFVKLKELLDSKVIGDLRLMEDTEQVGYWHYAHSFVRGNWRKEEEASPMIMAKCCHDLDLLQYYAGAKCASVYSIGDLSYFNKQHQPEGASDRCADCKYINECVYSAEKLYIDRWQRQGAKPDGWPYNIVCGQVPLTAEALRKCYTENNYGRCVFACDNNVVDNQYVTMEFENGVKANLTMTGFTRDMGRVITFHGTLGDIKFDEANDSLKIQVFGKETEELKVSELVKEFMLNSYGHGGGDYMLLNDLCDMVLNGKECATSLEMSVESHLMALAAEKSRKTGKVVNVHGKSI